MIRPTARARRVLAFAVLGVACLALGVRPQVLEVGRAGPHVRVCEGDLVSLRYIQSMYGVPVEERLRIESGSLILFEVVSTDAALEYLGIEARGANNVRRILQGFSIPADSVGNHVLFVAGRVIPLSSVPSEGGSIRIRLVRQPFLIYLIHQFKEFWR